MATGADQTAENDQLLTSFGEGGLDGKMRERQVRTQVRVREGVSASKEWVGVSGSGGLLQSRPPLPPPPPAP